eukprot:g11246.t1
MKISRVAAVGPLLLFAGRRAAAVPCASSTLVAPSVVEDTAGASRLAEAVDCSGGAFEVSWVGSVAVEQTILVPDGTVLSIVGLPDGSSVVDGAGEVQLFQVHRGALRLSGLSLVNGTNGVGGSIIAINSVVNASECEFSDNTASEGGAMYALGSFVNARDCKFTRNIASNGGAYFGGWGSRLQSDKCEFSHNSAGNGGAIILFSGSGFNGSESVFTDNIASDAGGGVYAGRSEVHANNCSFSYNSARIGGAMRAYNRSVVHASWSVFANNIASYHGGSSHLDDSVLTLDDCSLSYNNASFGGAVYGSTANVTVSRNTVFQDNIAVTSGGGVYLMDSSRLESPANDGGALFSGNRVVEGSGAGVYVTLSTIRLEGPTVFTNNSAGTTGGGMYLQGAYDLRIENARFSSNSAQTNGGAMTLVSAGKAGESGQILNSSFGGNVAGNTGGAVYLAGGFVDFNQSSFEGNIADTAGGAVYAASTAKIDGCIFSDNHAALGSAVSNVVSFDLQDTVFRDNALLCDDTRSFLNWTANVSAYEIACDQCDALCNGCTTVNPDKALLCADTFTNTDSLTADGTLETLNLAPGYWRSSNTSTEIRECPRAESCPGGTEGRCAVGYNGTFCAVCADGYSLGLGYTCSECDKGRRRWTIAVAVILPIAAAVAVAFASVASVTYPDLYAKFVGFFDLFDLDLNWMLSVDCYFDTDFYHTLLTTTIGPVVVSVFVLGSWWIRRRNCPADAQDRFSRINQRHAKSMYLISFLVYSSASSTVFQTFACDEIDRVDTKEYFLRADYSTQCYTTEHRVYMVYAGFMCLVYPLGIPVAYWSFLYKARKGFKSEEEEATGTNATVLRPLWQPYRRSVYYYEVVECFRRVTLSGLLVFVLPNTAGQVMTGFLLSVAFFALFTLLKPYENKRDTWLATVGHVIVMMSLFVAIAVKVDLEEDDGFSQEVFAGALVVINVVLVLIVAVEALLTCSDVVKEVREIREPVPNQRTA